MPSSALDTDVRAVVMTGSSKSYASLSFISLMNLAGGLAANSSWCTSAASARWPVMRATAPTSGPKSTSAVLVAAEGVAELASATSGLSSSMAFTSGAFMSSLSLMKVPVATLVAVSSGLSAFGSMPSITAANSGLFTSSTRSKEASLNSPAAYVGVL